MADHGNLRGPQHSAPAEELCRAADAKVGMISSENAEAWIGSEDDGRQAACSAIIPGRLVAREQRLPGTAPPVCRVNGGGPQNGRQCDVAHSGQLI